MSRSEVSKIFVLSKIVFCFIKKFIMRIDRFTMAVAEFSVFFPAGSAKKDYIAYFASAKTQGNKARGEFSTSRRGDGWIFISLIGRHVISLFSLH